MIRSKSFYNHESDNRIMIKKDKMEIANWTADLEYIHEELGYFLDIEDRMLKSAELYQKLHLVRRENTLRLGNFYRYEGSIKNAIECDTVQCDTYYLHTHEKFRNVYLDHLKKYRGVKNQVLSKILQYVNRKQT